MSEFWIKVGFFVFVLAPFWSVLFSFFTTFIKNETFKVALGTLFFVIAIQTFVADLVFLFVGLLIPGTMEAFLIAWNFFMYGSGVWWWIWSVAGYLLATFVYIGTESCDETYVGLVFKCTAIVAAIFFVLMFLNHVANSLVILG